jgi:hypothetical protein
MNTMAYLYCTPEWLEETNKAYQANPRFQESLKKLTATALYRVKAEPAWGIDTDIIFGAVVTKGMLSDLRFYSETEAKEKAPMVMVATPQQWKLILTKQHKFITDFMLGKIKLEKGSIAEALAVAPHADTFVDALTCVGLKFQDELTPQEVENYRKYASEFRARLGV